jgi:hypothetical protein
VRPHWWARCSCTTPMESSVLPLPIVSQTRCSFCLESPCD